MKVVLTYLNDFDLAHGFKKGVVYEVEEVEGEKAYIKSPYEPDEEIGFNSDEYLIVEP